VGFIADPAGAEKHYTVAVAYMKQEAYDKALEKLEKALSADPEMGHAHNARAVVMAHKGRLDEAYAGLERANLLLQGHPGIGINMAIIRYKQGREDEARALYRSVVEKNGTYSGYLHFLEEEQGEVDDGPVGFIADPAGAEKHYTVAVAYMKQEAYDRALEKLEKALVADPEMGHAHNARAVVMAHKGRLDEAYAGLERANVLLKGHPGIGINMAIIRYKQGREDEARTLYRSVVEKNGTYSGYLNFLEEEQGEVDEIEIE
jgi:tetratricopeptide (TPR) repeat protein